MSNPVSGTPSSVLLAIVFSILAVRPAVARTSPTTVTPDRSEVLVNKDLSGERWAIARDLSDGSVTGNVFVPGRDEANFVFCEQLSEDATSFGYRCYGAGRCDVADCATDWSFLSEPTLPKSFFAAGATSRGGAGPAAESPGSSTLPDERRPSSVSAAVSPGTESPDRRRILVSKDVGGERWAISRRLSDGTVTGNVFVQGQSSPNFLYCEQIGETGDAWSYRCLGTGACGVADCASDWREIARPTLPKSFFEVGSGLACPVGAEGPITDLAVDCRGVRYVYRRTVIGEIENWTLVTDGARVELCRSGGPAAAPYPVCLYGAVSSATEAVLDAERKAGADGATPLALPGRFTIALPDQPTGARMQIDYRPDPNSTFVLRAEWVASNAAD